MDVVKYLIQSIDGNNRLSGVVITTIKRCVDIHVVASCVNQTEVKVLHIEYSYIISNFNDITRRES